MRVRFAGERVIRSLATRIARLGGRTADESGVALVTVLVVVSAMTISTGMMVQMMTSNEKAFGRDRQVARATNIGQQGLNYGVAYMQSYLATYDSGNTLPIGSAVGTAASPKFSGSIDSGTMSWFATKTVSGAWTIYANAVSPSGDVSRRLSLTMGATASTTSTGGTASPVYAFGYVMADPNADCAGVTPPVN